MMMLINATTVHQKSWDSFVIVLALIKEGAFMAIEAKDITKKPAEKYSNN